MMLYRPYVGFVRDTSPDNVAVLYLQQGSDVRVFVEVAATVEILVNQFDDEIHVCFLRVELLYEVVCRTHRAARSQQIIVEQNHVVFRYHVLVDLDGIGAILLRVALLHRFCGQFAWFAT